MSATPASSVTSKAPTPEKFKFLIADDIALLKEVVSALREKPFSRGSAAWGTISDFLTKTDQKWKTVSIRTLRERTILIVKDYIKEDNYRRKQSGSSEEFDEKDQLLESVATLYREAKRAAEAQEKVAAAEQQRKDGEKQVVADMRVSAVNRLANKTATKDKAKEPSAKKPVPLSMADVLSKRQEDKKEMSQKEMELRERQLAFEEKKLEEAKAARREHHA